MCSKRVVGFHIFSTRQLVVICYYVPFNSSSPVPLLQRLYVFIQFLVLEQPLWQKLLGPPWLTSSWTSRTDKHKLSVRRPPNSRGKHVNFQSKLSHLPNYRDNYRLLEWTTCFSIKRHVDMQAKEVLISQPEGVKPLFWCPLMPGRTNLLIFRA